MVPRPVRILMVEDDPADVELTREAMKAGKISVIMDVVQDGVEALQYLRREDRFKESPKPDLVLLDLNLPKKNGFEVLREIKGDLDLKLIPVVILTTSGADTDVAKSYGLCANCYITKPVGLEQFEEVVRSLRDFWFTIVRLPNVPLK